MAPKKYTQMYLTFGPVATFPDNRREGAVVVPGPVDQTASESDEVPEVAPGKKPRRMLSYSTKSEIAKFRATSTMANTLAQFPEVSERTIRRIANSANKFEEAKHMGVGEMKKRRPLIKYKALGEQLHKFFLMVRAAEGVVTRALLEQFIASLPSEIQLDLMTLHDHRRDEFFARWRRWYKVVHRRVTWAKQFLPADYATRVGNFKSLLSSMYLEKRYTAFVCGDETGVRFEEVTPVTMNQRGAKKVTVRTTGQEKTMFTVYLSSMVQLDGNGVVMKCVKCKPLVIFKGATDGPVSRSVAAAAGSRAGALYIALAFTMFFLM
jgi:hypothetical protein